MPLAQMPAMNGVDHWQIAPKGGTSDGNSHKGFTGSTHRLVPPEETLARVGPFLPVMGITRVANVTGLDTIGIPVVMVCRPNSRSVSVSQGKGFDLAAAKASGVMESIESYHAERIDLPLKLGGFEDLRYANPMIDVGALPRFSDSRFTPFTQLLWIEGQDLMGGGPLWLPYELVHLNYTLPLPSGHGCFVASSNGLASGNHRLEAVSHGITEVVERDATTLWHLLDPEAQSALALTWIPSTTPAAGSLLDQYAAAGVLVAVWETTSDLGIPAFLCRILQDEGPPAKHHTPGFGHGLPPGSRRRAHARADRGRAEPTDLHLGRPRRHGPGRLRAVSRPRDLRCLAQDHGPRGAAP